MRLLVLAAAVLALAAPSRAQISLVPMVGYDIDYGAPMVGGGVELALPSGLLPFRTAIRPSAEYIFRDGNSSNGDARIRLNGDLIGRVAVVGVPFRPYGKAGIAFESASFDKEKLGLNLGVGAEFDRLLVEATAGFGVSAARIAVGYRF